MLKQLFGLSAIAMCAIISAAIPTGARAAAPRDACQVLPIAAAQTILGSPMEAHGMGPTTGRGATVTMCNYMGPQHGASLMLSYQASAAVASANASTMIARLNGNGHASRRGYGSGLAASKGNVLVMISVREKADVGKLQSLLAAAMRGL